MRRGQAGTEQAPADDAGAESQSQPCAQRRVHVRRARCLMPARSTENILRSHSGARDQAGDGDADVGAKNRCLHAATLEERRNVRSIETDDVDELTVSSEVPSGNRSEAPWVSSSGRWLEVVSNQGSAGCSCRVTPLTLGTSA